ncbi:MAG: YceI family protein [Deltaproteobacteria bacterium]
MPQYKLDAKRSRFTVQAFAGGMLSAFGHNPIFKIAEFTGEAGFSADAPEASSIRIVIMTDSLSLADNMSEKDRKDIESSMRTQVIETSRYPEVVFQSVGVTATKIANGWYRVIIDGELSLHGVTNKERVDTQMRVLPEGFRTSGEFMLKQSNYRIKPFSAAMGAVKVKDELKFTFDIFGAAEGG